MDDVREVGDRDAASRGGIDEGGGGGGGAEEGEDVVREREGGGGRGKGNGGAKAVEDFGLGRKAIVGIHGNLLFYINFAISLLSLIFLPKQTTLLDVSF